jgi:hypothetical protein
LRNSGLELAGAGLQREARVGGADVSQQAGAVRKSGSVSFWVCLYLFHCLLSIR